MNAPTVRAVRRELAHRIEIERGNNPMLRRSCAVSRSYGFPALLESRMPRVIPYSRFAASLLASSILFVGCSSDSKTDSQILRFSGIPDTDKARLIANSKIVEEYLSKEIGMEVEFVESANYSAACTGVASNKLDLVWLGGVTAVQSEKFSNNDVTLVACRASDLKFKTYFIANKAGLESGKIKIVDDLADAKDMLANCTFTFGSKDSTSGRVMPQHFMEKAGISIVDGVKGGAKFQAFGGHSATLKVVASGAVDVGVLNYLTWEKADAETKANAPIFYTTPEYVDYCMVVHNRIGQEMIDKIREAFTKLSPDDPEHARVLHAFSAKKFVAANAKDWDGIRAILEKIKLH